jgi:hypothetical protein
VGAAPADDILWPRISKEGTAKTHFIKIDGETIGGQRVERKYFETVVNTINTIPVPMILFYLFYYYKQSVMDGQQGQQLDITNLF